MSTYLVAYSLNEFKNKESETNMQDQILFKTWARPDAINQVTLKELLNIEIMLILVTITS